MSEFIIIQVGQCGNQIGSALWPLILQEYNVKLGKDTQVNYKGSNDVQKSFNSFFHVEDSKISESFETLEDVLTNNVKARAVCIDMEDSVLNRFKNGPLQNLFDKKCFISNYPGSGNNWAEGYCEHGPKYKDKILKVIQNAVERCDGLHGFLLLFSTGGGTGSGLGSYILSLLADYYPNIERFVSCVYPIGTEDVITCPYNMCLTTNELLKNATCVFPTENRALLDIISKKVKNHVPITNMLSMFRPFEDLNSIVVNMLLHLTSGSRFPGSLNFDMNELHTNMVPFPRLNFLSTGFSPLFSCSKNFKPVSKQSKTEHFLACCNRINQLIKTDPLGSKSVLLGTTLIGRGDYTLSDMRSYVEKIQAKAKFTPWSTKAVKVGLCNVPPYKGNMAMFGVFNSSSITHMFETINGYFNKLFHKKAHVHHYLSKEGFDMDFFEESQVALNDVIYSYKELESLQNTVIPRLPAINQL